MAKAREIANGGEMTRMEHLPQWAKDQIQRQEEWENSEEGVAYQLDLLMGEVDLARAIVRTVARLPVEVREYVYEKCKFIDCGGNTRGHVLPGYWLADAEWIIVLDAGMLGDLDEESVMGVIAHEIGHAWLKDDFFNPPVAFPDNEIRTANQARAWGFTGEGADPEHYRAAVEARGHSWPC